MTKIPMQIPRIQTLSFMKKQKKQKNSNLVMMKGESPFLKLINTP
jgi:hypothetical protein